MGVFIFFVMANNFVYSTWKPPQLKVTITPYLFLKHTVYIFYNIYILQETYFLSLLLKQDNSLFYMLAMLMSVNSSIIHSYSLIYFQTYSFIQNK